MCPPRTADEPSARPCRAGSCFLPLNPLSTERDGSREMRGRPLWISDLDASPRGHQRQSLPSLQQRGERPSRRMGGEPGDSDPADAERTDA